VKVGVVDVGSHTVRLLVAEHKRGALEPVWEERAALGLGAEVERLGLISREKLEETSDHVRGYARLARKAGAEVLEVIVTAPGRQSSNGRELVLELARATGYPSASSPPTRRADSPSQERSPSPICLERASRSAMSAGGRRKSSSVHASTARPGSGPSTSGRYA
jgi:hypothetical protein